MGDGGMSSREAHLDEQIAELTSQRDELMNALDDTLAALHVAHPRVALHSPLVAALAGYDFDRAPGRCQLCATATFHAAHLPSLDRLGPGDVMIRPDIDAIDADYKAAHVATDWNDEYDRSHIEVSYFVPDLVAYVRAFEAQRYELLGWALAGLDEHCCELRHCVKYESHDDCCGTPDGHQLIRRIAAGEFGPLT